MSLRIITDWSIPEETARVAHLAFPKGNTFIKLRDELGPLYKDSEFAPLFPLRGRPAESPGLLAMISVFQFVEGLTDRQAAEAVAGRIDWKYALGLELEESGFDHSVLCEFRGRLIESGTEQQLLDDLLIKIAELGLLKAGGKQRTDSTNVLAAIRKLNRLELAGETLRSALNALSITDPDWIGITVPTDWYERYKMRFDMYRLPKSENQQQQLALTIGSDGYALLEAVYNPETPMHIRNYPCVEILRQVWIQQFSVKEGEVHWRKLSNMPSAEHLIQSPCDPEARFSRRRDTEWTGYTIHMTETCDTELHVITHVETTPATTPDVAVTKTIHSALSSKGLLPGEHFTDAGYIDSEIVVSSRNEYGIDIIGPVPQDTSWQARAGQGFDLSAFSIDWEHKIVKCPQGQYNKVWSESRDTFGNSVIHVQFVPGDCCKCSVRSQCTRSKSGPRTLKLRPMEQHETLQNARKRQKTPEFKEHYAIRSGIEGTISQGVRACGLRNSRYIGYAKTHLQNILSAVAVNLLRFVDWVDQIPHAATRISQFGKLAA
ncbi:MAG: IS1182 family transposase [Desulfobacterales bacterium]|nr:IS1182 family transposase [Desulfobacterales bacterium]